MLQVADARGQALSLFQIIFKFQHPHYNSDGAHQRSLTIFCLFIIYSTFSYVLCDDVQCFSSIASAFIICCSSDTRLGGLLLVHYIYRPGELQIFWMKHDIAQECNPGEICGHGD